MEFKVSTMRTNIEVVLNQRSCINPRVISSSLNIATIKSAFKRNIVRIRNSTDKYATVYIPTSINLHRVRVINMITPSPFELFSVVASNIQPHMASIIVVVSEEMPIMVNYTSRRPFIPRRDLWYAKQHRPPRLRNMSKIIIY